jgi:ABC-type branched-subunit amino acid transport system substrate-binding protein
MIITGTSHSDNGKVLLPVADATQVPFIQNAASDQVISEYMFSVNWGYMANETYLLANYCRAKNFNRVCVVTDTAWHCREYVEYFTDACRRWKIDILSMGIASEFIGDEMRGQLKGFAEEHARLAPDAVVVLGSSPIAENYSWAAHVAGVKAERLMNADFPRIYWPPEHGILPESARRDMALLDTFTGWVGLSVYDEDNAVYQGVQRRYEAKYGEPIQLHDPGATYYDAVRACFEAIRMAPLMSPQGVKIGLEKLKQFPAATGTATNSLNFGPYDHMGYKGINAAVLRKITDGRKGISVVEHRFDTSL